MTIRIKLKPLSNFNESALKQVSYKLKYYFPEIKMVRYVKNDLLLFLNGDGCASSTLEKRIRIFLRKNIELIHSTSSRYEGDLIFSNLSQNNTRLSEKIESVSTREIYPSDTGLNIYRGWYCELLNAVTDISGEIADVLTKDAILTPSIISKTLLDEYKYVPSFFHHLNFVSKINPQNRMFNSFPRYYDQGDKKHLNAKCRQILSLPDQILSPAVCLHAYPLFRNRKIPGSMLPIRLSALGKSFRFESGNHNNTERLLEFSMREIISIGSHSMLLHESALLQKILIDLGQALGLTFTITTANDMFIGKDAATRTLSQNISKSKLEFNIYYPNSRRHVACASVNRHSTFFTGPMNIREKSTGALLESMCFGLGIERLSTMLMAYYQSDSLKILRQVKVKDLVSRAVEAHAGL